MQIALKFTNVRKVRMQIALKFTNATSMTSMTFKETTYKVMLGDDAVAVARRYNDDAEVVIVDSGRYRVHLTIDQWNTLFYQVDFINNGLEEIRKEIEKKRITSEDE
jgi:hypothetical protein